MEHLDVSRWGDLAAGRQAELLREMAKETARGDMPLDKYLWFHPEARFSPAEREQFRKWAEIEAAGIEKSRGGAGRDGSGGGGEADDQRE
jgi:hypothetical protein